jgi:hypothetical protein
MASRRSSAPSTGVALEPVHRCIGEMRTVEQIGHRDARELGEVRQEPGRILRQARDGAIHVRVVDLVDGNADRVAHAPQERGGRPSRRRETIRGRRGA